MRFFQLFWKVTWQALRPVSAVGDWQAMVTIVVFVIGSTLVPTFDHTKFLYSYLPNPGDRLAVVFAFAILLYLFASIKYLKELESIAESKPQLLIYPYWQRRPIENLSFSESPQFLLLKISNTPRIATDKATAQNLRARVLFRSSRLEREIKGAWVNRRYIHPDTMDRLTSDPIDLPNGDWREMAIAIQYEGEVSGHSFFLLEEGSCATGMAPWAPWTYPSLGISDDLRVQVEVSLLDQHGETKYRFPITVDKETDLFEIGALERFQTRQWRAINVPLSLWERFMIP
jgi:hypothetical protein